MPRPSRDPVEHAHDFAHRWVDRLENAVEGRMHALDVTEEMIGASDHARGIPWRVFFPDEPDGGGVSPDGRINVDSGVLNPELHPVKEWARARLRHRIDATIAHEYEEARGSSHEYSVEHAPETDLPVGGKVRAILRAIRLSEQGSRDAGSNPSP